MQQFPPVYGPPPPLPPPPRRDHTVLIVVIAAAVLFALVLIAVVAVVLIRSTGREEPAQLRRPLSIQQVTELTPGACADGSGVPAIDGSACHRLAPGMTIKRVEQIKVELTQATGDWHVLVVLGPVDRGAFGSLTRQVASEQPPRNQLAMVVDGKVIAAPSVQEPITGGEVQIYLRSRQEAELLVNRLTGTGQ